MDMDLVNLFVASFVTFFVLIDAPGVTPIFATLTADGSGKFRRTMAWRSVFVASIILTLFALGGSWLLGALHISIDAFRAAGGALLFLIALDMVFEKRTERREQRAEGVMEGHDDSRPEPEDISVFPIGIPMLAGPGSIASAMLFMSNESGNLLAQGVVLGAIFANLFLCLIFFLAAGPVMRFMGPSIAGAITRIFGVILAALSVQLLIDGLKGAFLAP